MENENTETLSKDVEGSDVSDISVKDGAEENVSQCEKGSNSDQSKCEVSLNKDSGEWSVNVNAAMYQWSLKQDWARLVYHTDDPEDDDSAWLSEFLPLEQCDPSTAKKIREFRCALGTDCLLKNPLDITPGTKKMEYKTRQWHEPCFSCCVCKSPIGTKSFIPREQEIYCATCYEEKFATRCVKCNKIITSGGVTYKNEPWHRECFTCTNCNASLAGQRFTSRDEKPYCADCFGELFAKRCTACSKPITGIGGTRFISFEDRHWHNDCFICASCKTSLVGRGFITDGDDIICPECAKQKLM